MTKVTILGQEPKEQKELKKIEFVTYLNKISLIPERCCSIASDWHNIELITKDYAKGFDLMYAYHVYREDGFLYLGHFNDGVV